MLFKLIRWINVLRLILSPKWYICLSRNHFLYTFGLFIIFQVINSLKAELESLAIFGHLIADAKFFAKSFSFINFSRARQFANFVVNSFARHARNITVLLVWIDDIPPHINVVFQTGLAFL